MVVPKDPQDLLPSVLDVIKVASRALERGVEDDDRVSHDSLRSLRNAAYCIQLIFHQLQAAGRGAELAGHAGAILDAVEANVSVPWQDYSTEIYPKCYALCRLVDAHPTDQLFLDSGDRDGLLRSLTDILDDLQIRFPDPSQLSVQPERRRWRDPQWGLFDSACHMFHAISLCQGPGCSAHEHLEARLALATYSNMSDEDAHFIDVLFTLNTDAPLWDEMRIQRHIPLVTSTGVTTRRAVPRVMFADQPTNHLSTAQRTKKPMRRQVSHFCKLLCKPESVKKGRINVTIGDGNDIWQTMPTPRTFKQTDLSQSVSLECILRSNIIDLNEMTKLVLAVILGYSLFYLYEGPWLGLHDSAGLSREKIMFFETDGRVPLRPFLHYDFRENSLDSEANDSEIPFHPNPVLVDFGITLIEIHLGCTLASFLHLSELPTSVDEKWVCASEVFEDRKPFIHGQNYRDAIEACLDIHFGGDGEDTNAKWNENMRNLIFNNIVHPLQDELEYGFGSFINFDSLDEQAANMDLCSGLLTTEVGGSSAVSQQSHPKHHLDSVNGKTSSHYKISNLETGQAITTRLGVSKEPDSPLLSLDSPNSTDTGELYTLFGDPNAPLSHSPKDASLTDKWFKGFECLQALRRLPELKPGDPRRVRIAILDTGIDMGHVSIQAARSQGRIAKVCDWVNGRDGVENAGMGDSSGHGTHVASIILNMAPNVELYIARVTEGPELRHSQAENIAKAITAASSTWGCAIINLSLGFPRGIPSIETALESAINAGVLVFAAASNDGANMGLAYPAWRSRVMCIYSTDGYGNPSKFNPSPDEHDDIGFSIVGEHVSGAWPSNLSDGMNYSTQRMSGTSVATPVAAALAACVLCCASVVFKPGELDKSFLKLASYEGMYKVLLEMVQKRKEYWYLNPFQLFNEKDREIRKRIWKALNPSKK